VEIFDDKELETERTELIDEASQLKRIFSAMLIKISESDKTHSIEVK